jgi:hypothetical protein
VPPGTAAPTRRAVNVFQDHAQSQTVSMASMPEWYVRARSGQAPAVHFTSAWNMVSKLAPPAVGAIVMYI